MTQTALPTALDEIKIGGLGASRRRVEDHRFIRGRGQYTDDGGTTLHYFRARPAPDRCLEASFSLNTRFTDDDQDVVPVRGLSAIVHETVGSTDRAVTILERDGAVQRAYSVDGQAAAWDSSAQQWYASIMPEVIRRTDAGAKARSERIIERQGVDGLMEELRAIPPNTGVRRTYLLAVLELDMLGERLVHLVKCLRERERAARGKAETAVRLALQARQVVKQR